MKENLIRIAQGAGQEILRLSEERSFIFKKDYSPITKADEASHSYLKASLSNIYNVPILSEEDYQPFEVRSHWKEFWLIDPLDGTKEFISGHNDFCINIALIQDSAPILAVIYAPKLEELYYAQKGCGFQYFGKPYTHLKEGLTVARSRFHHSESTAKFMELNNIVATDTIGSAIKFCRLALGSIDIYPRFEGSSEWDIAAGHLIIEEAGGYIIDLETQKKPVYNKPSLRNNNFIAARGAIDFNSLVFERTECEQ